MDKKHCWAIVVIFAIAMAWLESAVVVYLRTLIGRIDPYQPDPLPLFGDLGHIELGREIATMVMLITVGWLAGKNLRHRLAYATIVFGVWDIFYYVFLAPMSGWPRSIFDWDILFLVPLPWWGPVIAPASIAALIVIGGTLITQFDTRARRATWLAGIIGALIALGVFMRDALIAWRDGAMMFRNVLPTHFDWIWFAIGFALMALPVGEMIWGIGKSWSASNLPEKSARPIQPARGENS